MTKNQELQANSTPWPPSFRVSLHGLLLGLMILWSSSLWAHTPLLLIEDNPDGTIYVEAGFSDGGSAEGLGLQLQERGTGRVLGNHVFPKGSYLVLPRPSVPYTATFDSGAEHKLTKLGPWPEQNIEPTQALSTSAQPEEESPPSSEPTHVLTGWPIGYFLAKRLSQGVAVEVEYAYPVGMGLTEQPAYLQQQEKALQTLMKQTDLILSLRHFFPQDELYLWARRNNPRVVEVDLAFPFDPQASALQILRNGRGELLTGVWWNLANLNRMAEIVSVELERWRPNDAAKIQQNFLQLRQEIRSLRQSVEEALLNAEAWEVIELGDQYAYLWQDLGLVASLPTEEPLQAELPQSLQQQLSEVGGSVVVQAWEPTEQVQEQLRQAGHSLVVLEPLNYFRNSVSDTDFWQQYQQNLHSLVQGFQRLRKASAK